MSPRRSKRKCKGTFEHMAARTRNKKVEVEDFLKMEWSGRTPRSIPDPNTLWWYCIQRIPLHNWYIVLPKDFFNSNDLAFEPDNDGN